MAAEPRKNSYGRLYVKLLGLYPEPFRTRFAESMAQTFDDMFREHRDVGGPMLLFFARVFVDTATGIFRERRRTMSTRDKNIVRIVVVTGILLLVPLVAMQFSDEVDWNLFDFIVAGGLLLGAGLAFELVARRAKTGKYRFALGLAIGTALLLIWTNLAVGLLVSEDDPLNAMYLGVIAVGIVGAMIARLRPGGMAVTLFATAVVQALIPLVALLAVRPEVAAEGVGPGIIRVMVLNTIFVILFVVSGFLFRRADDPDVRRA